MSNQHVADERRADARTADNVTSSGNSTGLSVVLFIVLFGMFAGGLYLMSMMTMREPQPWLFISGLGLCILALFGTFDLVPRFLSK